MNHAHSEPVNILSMPDTSRSASARTLSAPQKRLTAIPLAFTLIFSAMAFLPPVRSSAHLQYTFISIGGIFLLWRAALSAIAARTGRPLAAEFLPVKSHYVQACVQLGILAYWGWFIPEVRWQAPLILAQLLFLYILDSLITWTRGRTWRLGFGPIPIIFSTNLLLWFKADHFAFQFLMLTIGLLGKQFITWTREGRRMHIFNPSAFGQFIVALVLIATGTTNEYTWGKQIAAGFDTPHMLVVIFLGGLVVQSLFHVTLMTVAAGLVLCLFNLAYTRLYGTYFFVNINVAAPIFLGIHLLITDPATSPKTNLGRVIFGALYGLAYCILFRMLDNYEVPTFWDKLLPVPILNLCVPMIDKLVRSGVVGRLNRTWETALSPRSLNFVHMACWSAFFATLWFTGFIDAPHPGASIPFWKKALADGKPHAAHSLVMAVGSQAEAGGSGAAFNELGLICMEGRIVKENHGAAARHFARASALGNINGSANVAIQYLFLHERKSDEDVARAFDHLERECGKDSDWGICFLIGVAYETGRGRPLDRNVAASLYERCGRGNVYAAKGLARIALSGEPATRDLGEVVQVLSKSAEIGDAESCWYLSYLYQQGVGIPCDEARARNYMERACKLGAAKACEALQQPTLPPYAKPRMLVPGWSTAFPLSTPAN